MKRLFLLFIFSLISVPYGSCDDFEIVSADQFLTTYRNLIAPKNSELYVPIKEPEIGELFGEMEQALKSNNRDMAISIRDALTNYGYFVQLVEIPGDNQPLLGYLEACDSNNPFFKGFGSFLCRPGSNNNFAIQCVHPKSDRYTEYLSIDAFLSITEITYLYLTGSHRHANRDYNGNGFSDSDTAHETHNHITALTRKHCQTRDSIEHIPVVIQFHGAYDRVTEPSIVASYGQDSLPKYSYFLEEINDLLEIEYPYTMGVCGYSEPFASSLEDSKYELCASGNTQGEVMRLFGHQNRFWHFEIERHFRDDYMNGFGPGYDTIHSLFDVMGIVLNDIDNSIDSPILLPVYQSIY